jgi:hypothetical protein
VAVPPALRVGLLGGGALSRTLSSASTVESLLSFDRVGDQARKMILVDRL